MWCPPDPGRCVARSNIPAERREHGFLEIPKFYRANKTASHVIRGRFQQIGDENLVPHRRVRFHVNTHVVKHKPAVTNCVRGVLIPGR